MSVVFFDVDTQIDFTFPAGALYAPGAAARVEAVAALTRHAAARGIPVIATADAHSENDPEFAHWPPHCVAGTIGQQKPANTLLKTHLTVPNRSLLLPPALPLQVIVEKQHTDCFTNPHVPVLLDRLAATRLVVYGFVTEVCVWQAVAGLLAAGREVDVVTDAVQGLRAADAEAALARVRERGGRVVTMAEVTR